MNDPFPSRNHHGRGDLVRDKTFGRSSTLDSDAGEHLRRSTSSLERRPQQARHLHEARSEDCFYLPDSPVSHNGFTFGPQQCLPSGSSEAKPPKISDEQRPGLARATSLLSRPLAPSQSRDVESLYSFPSGRAPAFGRSRRMSRSLPELSDIQFVSVLPDLEEEESDISEYQDDEGQEYKKPTRVPWHRKLDFVLCSVCQSLGLSNFWRFPYYCYSNGGGTFMLPYVILLVLCGVPLLCMELAIGQFTQSGPISALGQLCPLMKGIGVASTMLSFWITAYYSVFAAWTLFYAFNSFYSPPRWMRCTNTWNSNVCREQVLADKTTPSSEHDGTPPSLFINDTIDTDLVRNMLLGTDEPSTIASFLSDTSAANAEMLRNITHSSNSFPQNYTHPAVEFVHFKMLDTSKGIGESGELRFEILATVMFVWILTYFALRKTDFFRGTTIYVLTIISHLLLFSIFLRTVALEGAKNGLHFLFKPEWSKMAEARVWLYALAQAFHSLGVVLGPSILMGSCHKPHNNLLRDTIVLTVITFVTVILVSCVIFGTLGHLSLKLNRPVGSVLDDDPATVFVIYSVVIGSMPVPSCWGVIFFLVFLCLGLDSQIKLMATLVSALKEAYTYYIKQRFQGHSLFLAAICGVCFCATIPYLMQAGIYYLQLVDHYIAVLAVSVLALFEICTLGWLYGSANLSTCIQQMTGKTPSCFYKISWICLSPLTIIAILGYSAVTMSGKVIRPGYTYPSWAYITGWVLFALTLCWVPILAIAAYRKAPKANLFSRLNFTTRSKVGIHSDSTWEQKPVIILNGSTANEVYADYKMAELPSSANSLQSYVIERQPTSNQRNAETNI